MFTHVDSLLILFLLGSGVGLVSCCGLCILIIGWKGRWAAIALGGCVLACGLLALLLAAWQLPRYWWISLPPILLGIQSIRTWRNSATRRGVALSSLLLWISFIGAMSAGVGQLVRQRNAQREVVTRLEFLADGQVERDFDGLAVGLILHSGEPESLSETLMLAAKLPYLHRFQVSHCAISPEQAIQIGNLHGLRQLWLQATDIDDQTIAQLGRLKYLEDLDLMDTPVTGQGLQHLWKLTRLRRIWLSSVKIAPSDVEQLRDHLPRLTVSY